MTPPRSERKLRRRGSQNLHGKRKVAKYSIKGRCHGEEVKLFFCHAYDMPMRIAVRELICLAILCKTTILVSNYKNINPQHVCHV